MQNRSHFKSISCFNRLGSPAIEKRTKEPMIALNIVRENFLEVTEINLRFSRPWPGSERKKSLTLYSSTLLIFMIQYFFASVERT